MANVRIQGVQKSFGAVEVIRGIDVMIPDSEFVVLVGPSGCGKSTLLRMIAGLEDVTDGEIWIGDKIVNNLSPKDRDIAMVFQNYALYPHMTAWQNMAFSLKLRKVDAATTKKRVGDAMEMLGLSAISDRYPRQLSGGQRQRVAMGRAIVRDPQVFLFDEPLSNLDAKLRVQMRTEIKALHQRLRTTSVYVTHDQVEAMTMADRIVIMQAGIVEQIGTPLDVYDHPANLFVAGFVGSPAMNFLAGRLQQKESNWSVVLEEGGTIAVARPDRASDGLPVILGIRPEHLDISEGGVLPAKIEVVEPTGPQILISARLNKTPITAVVSERGNFVPGSIIPLVPRQESIHLFDAKTGMSLNEFKSAVH